MRTLPGLLLLASLAFFISPGASQAAVGDLTFDSCASDDGTGGLCTDLPSAPLDDPREMAISPDGDSVYVLGQEADGINHFTVGSDGRLTFAGCLSNSGANGCVNLPGAPIEAPSGVAVSPDGDSVYVVSRTYSVLSHFAASPTGSLTFAGCVSNDGVTGGSCFDLPGAPIQIPEDVTVSSDGASVYVASSANSAVSHFAAAPAGQLTFAGCVSDSGFGGCFDIPGTGTPLSNANGVAMSPDRDSVYVGAPGGVSHFFAAPAGQLTFGGCVNSNGSSGCFDVPGTPLDEAGPIVVSPDGGSVYVTARVSDSVVRFSAAPGGQITFADCVSNDGQGDVCADAPGNPLDVPNELALSPDGTDIYVSSFFSGSVTRIAAGAPGELAFAGCVSDNGSAGNCSDLPGILSFPTLGLAVAPDGASVYASAIGSNADAVVRLARELPDTTPPLLTLDARKAKAGKPVRVVVSCSEACSVDVTGSAKPKGAKRGNLLPATTDLAAGASATLTLKPRGKLKKSLRRAGKGKASIAATATDAAGNSADATDNVKLK